MTKSKLALSIIALSTLSTIAHAKDGVYVGAQLSNSTLTHSIERNTGDKTSASLTSQSDQSDFGVGILAGYKAHVTEAFYLAGELFYNQENIETRTINNLLVTDLELNSSYGVKLKAGFDVTDQFSVFASIGSTSLDFDIRNSYTFAPPMRDASATETEFTFGFGAQYAISDNWSITADYNQLNDLAFSPIPEVAVPGKINDNELDFSSLSLKLSYSF